MKYEMVAGFETHIELSTKTKIFCSCTTEFGGAPNTHCCPVCLGLPGVLPKLNRKAAEYAVMAGLAVNCEISRISKMDRKNYCYPDLPKAYQISQYDKPLCKNGFVELSDGKKIRIERIHIEEDAGKLIHKDGDIYVDYNRGGVPLIEIVSAPDIRTVSEAREYVEKLQQIMRYIGISDCRMQEGSMRCDVNISVRPVGEKELGTRTEIKNMNSVTNIVRAMEYEFERQCRLMENGEKVVQETLRFDDSTGKTLSMRSKEEADDYRYFREPDLVTISLTDEEIEEIKSALPELPNIKAKRYIEELSLTESDALNLTKYRKISEYFDEASKEVKTPKTVANFMIGQIFSRLETETQKETFDISVTPQQLADLVKLIEDKKINKSLAKTTLEKMLDTGKDCTDFISEEDMGGVDGDTLAEFCRQAIESNPNAVADYKAGKEKAFMVLLGNVMKLSRGKADARLTSEKLKELIG
ncbi:MAG: Asp-tRNA(Asn)/Glu-tRNA(Gln) amidotransferase subunit GatB [Ruminococcus sp.]